MKLENFIFILFLTLPFSSNAEVFKCKSTKGELIYQSGPCAKTVVPEGKLDIKDRTSEEQGAAKAKLKAEEQEQAAYEAAKADEAIKRQKEFKEQQELQLQQRRTQAIEEEADTESKRVYGGPGSPYWQPRDTDELR